MYILIFFSLDKVILILNNNKLYKYLAVIEKEICIVTDLTYIDMEKICKYILFKLYILKLTYGGKNFIIISI